MTNSVSSPFGYVLPPLIGAKAEWRQSEGRANPERRQSEPKVCPPTVIIIPKKSKIRVPLLRKKNGNKWHLMTMTMTITITISVRPLFTPHFTLHFTNCKTNAMTDSHIRSNVKL